MTKIKSVSPTAAASPKSIEVRYLAQKYGHREQARNLIARVGNDRERLDQAARELIWNLNA